MRAFIDWMCDTVETELGISMKVGAMPPINGVGIQQSSGSVMSEYLPRTALHRTTFVINSKDKAQGTALQNLVDIHEVLTKRIGYPSTDDWQITTVRTVNSPDFLGQENDEAYMYGSAVEVLWYDRKKAVDTPL